MTIKTTITFAPDAIVAINNLKSDTDADIKEIVATHEWLQARIAKLTAQTAIASPKRWHTRQKRATCLRLKARDA